MRKFLIFLGSIILLYGLGFLLFMQKIKHDNIPSEKVDALVVITGDRGRISTGLKLLEEQKGKVLFISGVKTKKGSTELFRKRPLFARNQIILGRKAFDTIGNAEETAQWLARTPHIQSFYLITSNYHLPRASVVFNFFLPDYEITPYPVSSNQSPEFLFKEYTKYILASIWHGLGMRSRVS